MSLQAAPTLDELAADPSLVDTLPLPVLVERSRRAERLAVDLRTCLLGRAAPQRLEQPPADPMAGGDRLLTVADAASKLGVSRDWLYRQGPKLPFTVRLGPRRLRFSLRGIERYIRQRQGRN